MVRGANGKGPLEYLVVEDDLAMARRVAVVLEEHAPVRIVATLAEARASAPQRPRWLGIVIDVRLPDGNGLDFLEALRQAGWIGPALIVTGWLRPDTMRRAQRLNAFVLPKPAPLEGLRSFARWTLLDRDRDHRLGAVVEASARLWELTPREQEVLELAVSGVARAELAREMGLGENTLKTHVRRLLRKSDHETLGDVVASVYRAVHRPAAVPSVQDDVAE